MEKKEKIKVLIVDDSALIRSLMTRIINEQSDMTVVAAAPDPYFARDHIRTYDPDVMTLDVEMPRMNGLDFLERVMRIHPLPVVMISSLTERGAEITMRALELGAIDFIAKPKLDINSGMLEYADEIAHKIRAAYAVRQRVRHAAINRSTRPREKIQPLPSVGNRFSSTEKVILIGASTGGTEAVKEVLMQMPPDCPGILITQHMPAGFTKSFAQRLDNLCRIAVKEAEDGERILPGHAYIAPGSHHMLLKRSGANYIVALSDSAPVNRHRPSVEVLFRSGAECAGNNAVGIMLTGMGKDGAQAMLDLRKSGAYNIAQDEASSVVFGMPREAIAMGATHVTLPLQEIAEHALNQLSTGSTRVVRV